MRRTRSDVAVLSLAATPGHLLRRAQQVHTALWTDVVGNDPTGPQYALLAAIATNPDIDQARAGELASLDKSSTADVIARLVDHGWIARTADPHDRRRRILTLTLAGHMIAVRLVTPV